MTHFSPLQAQITSDENGHFALDGLPASVHVLFNVNSKEWTSNKPIMMPTSADAPRLQLGRIAIANIAPNPAKIKLYPRCELIGTVVDRQGQPIAGVRLMSNSSGATTNDQGQYTLVRPDFDDWGPDESKLFVASFVVVPAENSQFANTYFIIDATHIAARTIKPCVLNGELLSGRLLSAVTQKPLAGIRVQLTGSSKRSVTGADGRFRLPIEFGQRELEFTPQWMTHDEQTRFLADPNSKAVKPSSTCLSAI